MEVRNDYVINTDAKVILNQYDEFGSLCSLVFEGEDIYSVKASPLTIVKKSIEYYGHSLQGAIAGAKSALGKISMPPVKISGKLGIYWFPVKSIMHEDHIWISIDHIADYYALSDKTVTVIFHDGSDIAVESSYNSFERKVNRALKYKNIMVNRTNGESLNSSNKLKGHGIERDPARKQYRYVSRKDYEK
ncbi:competence protein ComK [Bacillus sp. FJAT-49711]|uniref:competence protein ComK n=1 Tax=Bacillus sp. FJAT-49711 TaxID=2833585 RepID=UPI001BCA2E71|nr:competence protein ComK [Bacillus sp. FJAT-49711]MBS4219043.1 competence protein ComK [Bacillus sp. FJAT-49711]